MTQQEKDHTTEEKIKHAARTVFHRKGYAGTRTRDIAEEAGINLALLNYYYRSKEKLFDIIMFESLQGFLQSLTSVFKDETTTFNTKIENIPEKYIDYLTKYPELPLFIMSELKRNPKDLVDKMNVQELIFNSHFFKQYQEEVQKGNIAEPNPIHFIMNMIGLIVFPFIASPMLKLIGNLEEEQFNRLMLERKKMIPVWIKAMMSIK